MLSACDVTVLGSVRGMRGLQAKVGYGDSLPLRRGAEPRAAACSPPSRRMPVTQEIPRDGAVSHLWEAKVRG